MNLFSAKCPNCGADLKILLNKEMFICEYCQATIILSNLDEYKKMPNAKKYFYLANTYYEINDFKEALLYYNKVLEYEPRNFYAWLGKSKATAKLFDRYNPKIPEVINYCKKSLEYSNLSKNHIIEKDVSNFVNELLINYHREHVFNNSNKVTFSLYYNKNLVKDIFKFSDDLNSKSDEFRSNLILVCKDNIMYNSYDVYWHEKFKEIDSSGYNDFLKNIESQKDKVKRLKDIEERKKRQELAQKIEDGNKAAIYSYTKNFAVCGFIIGILFGIYLKLSADISNSLHLLFLFTISALFALIGNAIARTKNQSH